MPDKVKPRITIQLDKERHLFLDLNAMVAFEEVTGKNLLQGIAPEALSVKDFRALLWACLIHEDKELTLDDVGTMIHSGNMSELVSKLAQAWDVAMPEPTGESDPLAESLQSG